MENFLLKEANTFFFNPFVDDNTEIVIIMIVGTFLGSKKGRVAVENYFEVVIPRYTDYGKSV